jgi:rhamnosyltransferase
MFALSYSVAVVVPTLNAGDAWKAWLDALLAQTLRPRRVLVIDSSSEDATATSAREAGLEVHSIARWEFDHGGTRQRGVEMTAGTDLVVFLSQDATLAHPEALEKLVSCFDNPEVGAAYGRQLPHPGANPIEAHGRMFNYPPPSRLKRMADAPRDGFRTIFFSNAFAAYRRSALEQVGGFKSGLISMEDEYVAARMVQAGFAIAYCAEARVYHSHAYSVAQEFKRYFDFGVFHAREAWIRRTFGEAEGEGLHFVRSQLAYLWREQPLLIALAVIRMAAKLIGFRLGTMEKWWPIGMKRRLSMNPKFWTNDQTVTRRQ